MAFLHLTLLATAPLLLIGVVGVILWCRSRFTTPRRPLTLLGVVTHPLAIVASLAGAYLPLSGAYQLASLRCGAQCGYAGDCDTAPQWYRGGLRGLAYGFEKQRHFECIATSDADCAASTRCRQKGECVVVDGRCRVARRDDCLASEFCKRWGRCTPVEDRCVPVGDDCRHTEACRREGLCGGDGRYCVAVAAEDCASTSGCLRYGNCAPAPQTARWGTRPACGPTLAIHCRQSEECADHHACSLVDGGCEVTRADCEPTDECKAEGACSPTTLGCSAQGGDCAHATTCATSRRCVADNGECIVDEDQCADSGACLFHGRCATDTLGKCVARNDDDCRQSTRCRAEGACHRRGDACVAQARAANASTPHQPRSTTPP